jgi:hypothetical protein
MATYASVRGWIECDPDQLDEIKEIISGKPHELYSGGWGFPGHAFNWTSYVFYGGDLQVQDLPWLRGVIEEIAAIPPCDEMDVRVQGFFLVTCETEGVIEWQIRDGGLHEEPNGCRLAYLGP